MYDALYGPRNEEGMPAGSALSELGYSPQMVIKM